MKLFICLLVFVSTTYAAFFMDDEFVRVKDEVEDEVEDFVQVQEDGFKYDDEYENQENDLRAACPNAQKVVCQIPQSEIKDKFLSSHNYIRGLHKDTAPLTWDTDLVRNAQAYADVLAKKGAAFEHANQKKEGENLMKGVDPQFKTQKVEKCMYLWYEEINDWDFVKPQIYNLFGTKGLGHFSQLVWTDSKRVGCAGSLRNDPSDGGRLTVYVCRYSPPGNKMGEFDKKVKNLKSGQKANVQKSFIGTLENQGPASSAGCKDDFSLCSKYADKCGIDQKMTNMCKNTCNRC